MTSFTHPITNKLVILESINPRKWIYDGRVICPDETGFNLEDFELCHIYLSIMINDENITPYLYYPTFTTTLSPTVYNSILSTKLPDGFILAWYDIMLDGYPEEYPKTYGELLKTIGNDILLCDKPIPKLEYDKNMKRSKILQTHKSEIDKLREEFKKIGIGKYEKDLNYRFFENHLMFGSFRQGSAQKDFAEVIGSKKFLKEWREKNKDKNSNT